MRLSVTRTAKICPIEIAAIISACVTGKIAQVHSRPCSPNYNLVFLPPSSLWPTLLWPTPLENCGMVGLGRKEEAGWASVTGRFRGSSKLKFIDRISHRRRVEDVVP
jgi:hypothetical protein